MPQIGWLEILAVVIVAILVLGPKEFPVALRKIGSYIGKIKNTFSNFQKEISSVTDNVDLDKDSASIKLLEDEYGISPGQACVFYSKNKIGYKVLGGGWITK